MLLTCTTKSGDQTLKVDGETKTFSFKYGETTFTGAFTVEANKSLKCSNIEAATAFTATLAPVDVESNLIGQFHFTTVEIDELKALKERYVVDFTKQDNKSPDNVVTSQAAIGSFNFTMFVTNKGEQYAVYTLNGEDQTAVKSNVCII